MNKTYEQAKDLHVRAVTVYGKAADKKLYWNLSGSTYSEQVKQAELEDLFGKGLLIINDGTNKLVPVSITANKAVTLAVTSGSSGSSDTVGPVTWTTVATPTE